MTVVNITHHPARWQELERLTRLLRPMPAGSRLNVTIDSVGDGPWPTFRRGLLAAFATEPGEHGCIVLLEDDALPVRHLVAVCEQLHQAQPRRIWRLFSQHVMPSPDIVGMFAAQDAGRHVIEIPYTGGAVALILPFVRIIEFVTWELKHWPGAGGYQREDDAMLLDSRLRAWLQSRNETTLVTVPSLVEHAPMNGSLIGTQALRAASFPGSRFDALSIDWTKEAADPLRVRLPA